MIIRLGKALEVEGEPEEILKLLKGFDGIITSVEDLDEIAGIIATELQKRGTTRV